MEINMKIIIIGCGKIGSTLADKLNREGNDVVVIDKNAAKVKEVANKHDLMGIIGNGSTRKIQKEAGIDSADLVIAVTGSDELNLLSCVMAKRKTDCQTIARVKRPEYSGESQYLRDEFDLSMVINPEYMAAEEIARLLKFPAALSIDSFAGGRVELLKLRLPEGCDLVGRSLKEAMLKLKSDVLICTVERGDEAFIPKGDFVFQERDVISIAASQKNAQDFFKKLNHKLDSAKTATIVGGGVVTHYLCEILEKSNISLKIIEKDDSVCNDFSNKFDNVTVISANPADESILKEEGAAKTDAFIALTDLDEENILLSLFAKESGSRKVITKINRIDYNSVISKLDLDSIVYPKNIAADLCIRHVRAKNKTRGSSMKNFYNIINDQVEATEFTVEEGSPLIGKPLLTLKLKENILIAAILRGKTVLVPRGSSVIEKGDSVVIVAKGLSVRSLSEILKK